MTTARKGNTTEAAVLSALVDRDYAVLLPFGEGHPYDLVVHLGSNSFLRVQCKTARVSRDCLIFNSRSTDHGRGEGTYIGLADLFAAYCPATGHLYLAPVQEMARSAVYLRLKPARNNQQRGVRFAADYEIDQWTVERLCNVLEHDPAAREPTFLSMG